MCVCLEFETNASFLSEKRKKATPRARSLFVFHHEHVVHYERRTSTCFPAHSHKKKGSHMADEDEDYIAEEEEEEEEEDDDDDDSHVSGDDDGDDVDDEDEDDEPTVKNSKVRSR